MFGTHHVNLRREYYDELTVFGSNSVAGFIDLATEIVREWQQSWLDVTGHELNPHISGLLVPTIVLVGSVVSDLSLFWNLRSASDTMHPAWIIPIPADAATDPAVVEKLKDWLLAFLPYGRRPNYCLVTSQSVEEQVCQNFAQQFRVVLDGTPIESVDYEPPRNRLPLVVPFEYETAWAVEINGQKLTVQPPRPKAFGDLGLSCSWFVDLLKDVKTGRAVKELQLPSSPVVLELLNGPCPPTFETARIPRAADGTESVNLRCSGKKEVINQHLPSGEELLEEILREHGIEPIGDEKRRLYLPAIKRLGGVQHAGAAFSGPSGTILSALAKGTKTIGEIRGACKLGGGDLPGEGYSQRIERVLAGNSDRIKRVGMSRFQHYARHSTPENLELRSLLEFWADRSILVRRWRLGPCSRCGQTYDEPQLNIQKRVQCPGCGNRITLPTKVPLSYSLHQTIRRAIDEGIIPVALTGRFLRQMSYRGFFWLPGVKYHDGTKAGDTDIVACCDGELVFCECKNVEETPHDARVWEELRTQFLETANVAKRCGGSLVVLAARVDRYPQAVQSSIETELRDSIPYLLLDKQDLEKGYRSTSAEPHHRPLSIRDLVRNPFPEKPRPQSDKPRTIKMGWGIHTQGS
jgi:DNA-directed RNA polymerase subunit RPC12/RpoP